MLVEGTQYSLNHPSIFYSCLFTSFGRRGLLEPIPPVKGQGAGGGIGWQPIQGVSHSLNHVNATF